MGRLPPQFEKILVALGFTPVQARWKLRYLEQWWGERVEKLTQRAPKKRYKWCQHCSQMALADAKVCACGERLPSYAAYRLRRALALGKPQVGYVSTGFLGVILFIFCAQAALFGLGEILSPSNEGFLAAGGFSTQLLRQGALWRVLSFALVHIGVIHLLFNVAAISQMLPRLEEDIGPLPTLAIVTLTQLGAVAGHVVCYDPHVLTAGASGVAFGLIGFGVAYSHRRGLAAERRFFLQWCVYGLIFGVLIRANNAAHIGGFVAGLPLGHFLAGLRLRGKTRAAWQAAGAFGLVLWILTLACVAWSIFTNYSVVAATG